jgi:hypothetical protein
LHFQVNETVIQKQFSQISNLFDKSEDYIKTLFRITDREFKNEVVTLKIQFISNSEAGEVEFVDQEK